MKNVNLNTSDPAMENVEIQANDEFLLTAMKGCLIGTAVGDALGLPFEGMTPRRIQRLRPLPLRHRFFFGRGMISDDTEHTCLVAQSLLVSGEDVSLFTKQLAKRLRWWLLGLPAGIGFATLRSLIKLWLGVSPTKSGVWSAGNGPAMRSAIIGVYAGDNEKLLVDLVTKSTGISHSDPRAVKGAIIVAKLAALNSTGKTLDTYRCVSQLSAIIGDDDALREIMNQVVESVKTGESAQTFCKGQGFKRGVTGYIYNTLPVVVHVWMRHPRDYAAAMNEVIPCGGDTDTVAAILGGIVGAGSGIEGVPKAWVNGIMEWPRSVNWMSKLATELANRSVGNKRHKSVPINIPGIMIRNIFFMVWVLFHGFRRLLPPY